MEQSKDDLVTTLWQCKMTFEKKIDTSAKSPAEIRRAFRDVTVIRLG